MAIVACVVLICLSACCNILNADEYSDINDAIPKLDYKSPEPSGFAHLAEHFDSEERFRNAWVLSEAKKDSIQNTDEDIAKYDGIWSIEGPKRYSEDGNLGLVLKSKARHAAVSTLLTKLLSV